MHNRHLRAKWLAFAALLFSIPIAVGILRGEPAADSGKAAYPEHPERKKVDPIAVNGEIFVDDILAEAGCCAGVFRRAKRLPGAVRLRGVGKPKGRAEAAIHVS